VKLEFYILIHEHQYGQTLFAFYYQPTPARPYPSVLKVVARFGVEYEPAAGESVLLHTVEGDEPDLILTAGEVGSAQAEFSDFK
jgi:hypothetical protein